MMGPMFFVDIAIGIDIPTEVRPAGQALELQFGLTVFAAYAFGCVMATLAHLDDDNQPSPKRLITPNGE